jgi:hypothetical protein
VSVKTKSLLRVLGIVNYLVGALMASVIISKLLLAEDGYSQTQIMYVISFGAITLIILVFTLYLLRVKKLI